MAPFRRTKWVFFTFSGPKVGVVKRSKAASAKPNMKAALGPCSVDMQVTSLEELTLPMVLDKIKKLPGVDGESVTEGNVSGLAAGGGVGGGGRTRAPCFKQCLSRTTHTHFHHPAGGEPG